MTFAIWYAGGKRVVGRTRDEWLRAPSEGIVGVASITGYDEHGRTLGAYAMGGDWYWWDETGIDCGDSALEVGTWLDYDGPAGQAGAKRGVWVAHTLLGIVQYEMREFVR